MVSASVPAITLLPALGPFFDVPQMMTEASEPNQLIPVPLDFGQCFLTATETQTTPPCL